MRPSEIRKAAALTSNTCDHELTARGKPVWEGAAPAPGRYLAYKARTGVGLVGAVGPY